MYSLLFINYTKIKLENKANKAKKKITASEQLLL